MYNIYAIYKQCLSVCLLLLTGISLVSAASLPDYSANRAHLSIVDSGGVKGLKDYYARYFPVGVAVSVRDLHGASARLIVNEFNSITPENAMKMGVIHPREHLYNWTAADAIVAFATRHHLKVRGHNLCWHQQAPKWIFLDSTGQLASKALLLKRLKSHISTVVKRYKGRVYAWDVVNEAIADDPNRDYRQSLWYKICGKDYIAKAFEYAHQADPTAILFYNDYNTEDPVKREKIYQMLKTLLARGVPIDGVGLQGHWSVSNPSRAALQQSIKRFSALGLQVQVTEMDVSVYAGHRGGRLINGRKDTTGRFTREMEQKQLQQYKMLFEVFRQNRHALTGITFWNLSDRYSWLDGRGRKNYPLLFDQNFKRKRAYQAVTSFAK